MGVHGAMNATAINLGIFHIDGPKNLPLSIQLNCYAVLFTPLGTHLDDVSFMLLGGLSRDFKSITACDHSGPIEGTAMG